MRIKSALLVMNGVVLFLVGVLVGGFVQRPVGAQSRTESGQNGSWAIVEMSHAQRFDGYIFNTQTGEVYQLESANKILVKTKQ